MIRATLATLAGAVLAGVAVAVAVALDPSTAPLATLALAGAGDMLAGVAHWFADTAVLSVPAALAVAFLAVWVTCEAIGSRM